MLFFTALDEWLLSIQGLSKDTQKHYIAAVKAFHIDFPKKYIHEYTSADLQRYFKKFRWTHKNTTANTNLGAIKSFFRFLSTTYGITNIASEVKLFKKNLPHRPFISKKDLDKILLNATQKEADIIRMLAHTGMRCSELAGLRPENISPNLSSITIQGKGGKVRTIPCNQTVREILSRTMDFPKNRKNIYNACLKSGKKVEQRLSPHMLRRLFATQLLAKGVSLLIISRLLSHASVHQTEIYLCVDSSFLAGSTDCLD